MKKYRTKSGKVEEKLPGINATVSPSEKAQIAMAGGANTLGDVQTILGISGKKNNLKGQGAKHLVSFNGDDEFGGDFGSYDTEAATGPDSGYDPDEGGASGATSGVAGTPASGVSEFSSGGGDDSGPALVPIPAPVPRRAPAPASPWLILEILQNKRRQKKKEQVLEIC